MKITKSNLEKIIQEELENEMALPFMSQGVSDVVTGNFIYDGLQIIGSLVVGLLGVGAIKLIQVKRDLDEKARLNVIKQKQAEKAKRVADLVEKYKDNQELISLLRNKKLKLFSQKLSELEGGSGEKVGKQTARDVYHGSKKKHGIQQ